jgi:hypothetical protein
MNGALAAMVDKIFNSAFASAYTAIFEVGSVMAVLMLVFGFLDYKYGTRLRQFIEDKKLDKPVVMVGLALIPVDGTLLFQYSTYRRGAIRLGSLLAGVIGIGEEATYLILTYQPLAWLGIASIKIVMAIIFGGIFNKSKRIAALTEQLHKKDLAFSIDENAVKADENFHELPDKFRHKLHHFRYHKLGKAFWIFFAVAFFLQMVLNLLSGAKLIDLDKVQAMGIPFVSWLAMIGLFIVLIYRLLVKLTTQEFGKIFEHEYQDSGDAIGDLAETCASVILLIFLLTFVVTTAIDLIGMDRLGQFFAGRGLLAVGIGALIGLIPGTGASLAFTTLYFALAGSPGQMPFAALVACSVALIGDSQFIGGRQLRFSQRTAHLTAFGIALLAGLLTFGVEYLIR